MRPNIEPPGPLLITEILQSIYENIEIIYKAFVSTISKTRVPTFAWKQKHKSTEIKTNINMDMNYLRYIYFQMKESPAPLNIPTPTPASDRGGPVACVGGPGSRVGSSRRAGGSNLDTGAANGGGLSSSRPASLNPLVNCSPCVGLRRSQNGVRKRVLFLWVSVNSCGWANQMKKTAWLFLSMSYG